MATSALNIAQVAKVIGRSTKSIRNYIREGKLKAEKISSPRGLEYRFDFGDVAEFARKHLDISVEANITNAPQASRGAGRPTVSAGNSADLMKLIASIEKEKTDLLKELGEMKAQAGYKIGQLESQVKLLETARHERDDLHVRYTSLQHEMKTLQKMKEYYDRKKWWQFWKGSYAEQMISIEDK